MRSHNKECRNRPIEKMEETNEGKRALTGARGRLSKGRPHVSESPTFGTAFRDPVPSGFDPQVAVDQMSSDAGASCDSSNGSSTIRSFRQILKSMGCNLEQAKGSLKRIGDELHRNAVKAKSRALRQALSIGIGEAYSQFRINFEGPKRGFWK